MGILQRKQEKQTDGLVMTLERADELNHRWAQRFENFDFKTEPKLVRLTAMGRVEFNEEDETFMLRLSKNYPLKNGEILGSLTFQEPTGHMLKMAAKDRDPRTDSMGVTMRLLSNCSGQPEGVFDMLNKRDFENAALVLTFFG